MKIKNCESKLFEDNFISYEEETILESLRTVNDPQKIIENLIDNSKFINQIEDKELCKTILTFIKHCNLNDSIILKIIGFITERFAHQNCDFRDRACFIATALFKKDEFNANTRASFNEFEKFIDPSIFKSKNKLYSKYENYTEIKNTQFLKPKYENMDLYTPIYLEKALKIIKEGIDMNLILQVYNSFESILQRSTRRCIEIHSNEFFNQFLELTNLDLYDLQSKNLAILLKLNINLIEKLIERLKSANSDILKAFIVSTVDNLYDLLDYKNQVTLQLKMSELILNSSFKFDSITKSMLIAFVEKGMKNLNIKV